MSALDGGKTYADIKSKVETGIPLTKQDLMSIVFLPMMKNHVEKSVQFEQAIALSKAVPGKSAQTQVQAMLQLLADKFIKDQNILRKLKELISMGTIAEMIRDDAIRDNSVEIAKKLLRRGLSVAVVVEDTGLDEPTVLDIKTEIGVL